MQAQQLEAIKNLIKSLPEEERLQVIEQSAMPEKLLANASPSTKWEKSDRFVIVFGSIMIIGYSIFGKTSLVGSILLGIVVGLYTIGWKPFNRG